MVSFTAVAVPRFNERVVLLRRPVAELYLFVVVEVSVGIVCLHRLVNVAPVFVGHCGRSQATAKLDGSGLYRSALIVVINGIRQCAAVAGLTDTSRQ